MNYLGVRTAYIEHAITDKLYAGHALQFGTLTLGSYYHSSQTWYTETSVDAFRSSCNCIAVIARTHHYLKSKTRLTNCLRSSSQYVVRTTMHPSK